MTAAAPTAPLPRPDLVWERDSLFREPVYVDGRDYADLDDGDDGGEW